MSLFNTYSKSYLCKHLGAILKNNKTKQIQRIIGWLISYYYRFEKSEVSKTNVVYVSLEILQICHTWKPDKTKLNLPSSPPPSHLKASVWSKLFSLKEMSHVPLLQMYHVQKVSDELSEFPLQFLVNYTIDNL